MKFQEQRIEALKSRLDGHNLEQLKNMTKAEQLAVALVGTTKNDYVVFILGFFSSIVIDEIIGLFGYKVMDDLVGFISSFVNVLIFVMINFYLLNTSIYLSELQQKFNSKPTPTAGYNMLMNNFETTKEKIHNIVIYTKKGAIFCLVALCLNVISFLYINLF